MLSPKHVAAFPNGLMLLAVSCRHRVFKRCSRVLSGRDVPPSSSCPGQMPWKGFPQGATNRAGFVAQERLGPALRTIVHSPLSHSPRAGQGLAQTTTCLCSPVPREPQQKNRKTNVNKRQDLKTSVCLVHLPRYCSLAQISNMIAAAQVDQGWQSRQRCSPGSTSTVHSSGARRHAEAPETLQFEY